MTDSFTFSFAHDGNPVTLTRPASANATPSFFAIGLPKAGSTLLHGLLEQLCKAIELPTMQIDSLLYRQGLKPRDLPAAAMALFAPQGYGFIGHRTVPPIGLPAFAKGRTLALVRDPRDMIVSLFFSLGFSHAAPGTAGGDAAKTAFNARRDAVRSADINAWVLENCQPIIGNFNRLQRVTRDFDIKIWRYEDVIFDQLNWAQAMVSYLKLDVPQTVIASVVAGQARPPATEDASKHVRKASPGDHLEKLTPQTIAALNEKFAPILTRFNYARDASLPAPPYSQDL